MARTLTMVTRGKQEPTVTELCYLAGVMDSDGCFAVSKMKAGFQKTKTPRYVFKMEVTNTSEALMKWLVEKFGGRYQLRRQQSDKHKPTFNWYFENGKSIWLLKLVEPYLVVKGEQCRLGIQFLENWVTVQRGPGSFSRTPEHEVARREACYLGMKELNRFGPVQPQRLSPLAPAQQGDAIV